MIRVYEFGLGQQARESQRLRLLPALALVADQHRNGDPKFQRSLGRAQRDFILRRHHPNALGPTA